MTKPKHWTALGRSKTTGLLQVFPPDVEPAYEQEVSA